MAGSSGLVLVTEETALGWAGVALSPAGIRYATLFAKTEAEIVQQLSARGASPGDDNRAESIRSSLRFFAESGEGDLDSFPIDLPPCSDFERAAWLALRDIPKGETRSYGWVAEHIGAPPSASRAIGQAMHTNPVPPWLACHRVVASDGTLHGYGGGLDLKRRLLELEGALPKPLFVL